MVLVSHITRPVDGLVYTSDNVKLQISNQTIGTGKLYISQNSLSWQPNDKPEGISIFWKQISVHGVSSNPTKCIYLTLDHQLVWDGVYDPVNIRIGNGGGVMDQNLDDDNDQDEGNESDNEEMTEMWLLPQDVNSVETIFQAMSDCQALHPDSADSFSDESDFMDDDGNDDDDENEIIGAPLVNNSAADGNAIVQGDMENLNLNDRFADADE